MRNLQLSEINNLVEVSKILAQTPFYQKLGAGGVLAIYLTAMELNLPPMFCLNGGLHNIEGKVSLSGQAINMMLCNAGWQVFFKEMSDTKCHLQFKYPNSNRVEDFIYTIEEAQKAGYLGIPGPQGTWTKKPKDNWLYHAKDMLFSRCIASGGRKYAPSVLGNCYGIGELDDKELLPNLSQNRSESQPNSNNKYLNLQPNFDESNKNLDDVNKFRDRHNIKEGEKVYDFVLNIAHQKKIDPEQAMTQCFLNEEKFVESFKRFEEKTKT